METNIDWLAVGLFTLKTLNVDLELAAVARNDLALLALVVSSDHLHTKSSRSASG